MSLIFSTRFFGGVLAAGLQELFAVPSSQTCVLHDLEIVNLTGSPADIYVGSNGPGSTLIWFLYVPAMSSNAAHQWQGRLVIPSSGALSADSSVANVSLTASGYLLGP